MRVAPAVACLVVALAAAVALPGAVAHETPPPYPTFEPNDDFASATPIEPRTLHGLRPIKFTDRSPGPAIRAPSGFWMLESTDEDYYAVELDRGDPLPVTLYHDGADGNLLVDVYDPSETRLVTIDPDGNWQRGGSTLTRSDRAIQRGAHTVTARCSGTHYVRVRSEDASHAPYRLEIDDRFEQNDATTAAPRITAGTHEDLAITTEDPDHYALRVRKGEHVDVVLEMTTQAHWEITPAGDKPVSIEDPVTEEEWAPYNHTRWDDPSFVLKAWDSLPNGSGDYTLQPIKPVRWDGIHRNKLSLDITESGTIYLKLLPNTWWTSSIDGAPAWAANAARYDLTITRSGTPVDDGTAEASTDDGSSAGDDAAGGDPVREALERVDADAAGAGDDAGIAASQLAGERVTLRVDGEGAYSFEVGEDLGITDVGGCGHEDPTVRIATDGDTLDAIEGADSPKTALVDAYGRGDLRIEGVGTVNEVKWGALNGVAGLAENAPF